MMNLFPIKKNPEENTSFATDSASRDILKMTVDFYLRTGYDPPWICYFIEREGKIVGSAGFKGKPVDGKVEIAYGVFTRYQNQGIGTAICKLLVTLSLKTDPSITISARTLPEPNFSTKILVKNNFKLAGTVNDPEDGQVWEWIYHPEWLHR